MVRSLELDFDVHASGQVELHKRIDRLRGRVHNIEQALVSAHLELLAALLVDVRRAVDRELLDPGRQRNRATDIGAGALCRRHDLPRGSVEYSMIERFKSDADI